MKFSKNKIHIHEGICFHDGQLKIGKPWIVRQMYHDTHHYLFKPRIDCFTFSTLFRQNLSFEF